MHPARSLLALAAAALLGGLALHAADLADLKARGTLRVIVAADEAKETFDPRGERRGASSASSWRHSGASRG